MKIVVSGLVAVCVATMLAVLAGFVESGLHFYTAQLALLAGILIGFFAWFSMSGGFRAVFRLGGAGLPAGALDEHQPVSGWVEWGVIVAFVLFALRCFCWLIFQVKDDIDFLSPNNLGDLSLHITHIQYLANGAPFWPENPIFAHADLHYPFGVDLFNAVLRLSGISIVPGLVWVGLLASFATGVMLRRWGGPFAMAGFLFCGGLAGFAIFKTIHWEGGHLLMHWEDYQDSFTGADGQQHYIYWKSIPLALFVTQRGLLYAIPAGLALLWSWRERILREKPGLPFWVEALFYGTMPLFHLHTFIFLSVMLGSWLLAAILAQYWKPLPKIPAKVPCAGMFDSFLTRVREAFLDVAPHSPQHVQRETLTLIAVAFLPASVLVWFLTGGMHSGGVIHIKVGWLQDEDFFVFWLRNFGFLPFCVAALCAWLWNRRKSPQTAELAALVIPAVLFFLVTCIVMFAPWEWDNTKLMIWCYFVVLPPLWVMFCNFNRWIRAAACFALFFSGFVSLWGGIDGSHHGYSLGRRLELDALAMPLRKIPVTATFACNATFNHPLLLLGHKAVAGYWGHLNSHGINYEPRKKKLDTLMRGEPGWEECARLLMVDYLFWGEREEKEYGSSTQPWREHAPIVAQGNWGTIYDMRGLTAEPK